MGYVAFGEEELALLREVIDSQTLWRLGGVGMVERFEQRFAEHLGRRYTLGVCTGTSADETALFGAGVGPGDEVICPAAAPIFVSLPVISLGAVPVFAECDPRTMILDPAAVEERITHRTTALLVVHLWGQPAPMDELLAVAARHGLKVVEDCAQAYDAFYQGRKVGTLGDVAAFSLQQSKHITAGEGGLVASDDPETYRRMVTFSNSGMAWYGFGLERPKAEPVAGIPTRGHYTFGHDYRMSELAGAVALAQLDKIDRFNHRRRELVAILEEELGGVPGIELAHVYEGTEPNYWAYPVRVPEGLGTYAEINYQEVIFQEIQRDRRTSLGQPLPDYVQYRPGICPVTEAAAKRIRTFSTHPLTDGEALRKQAAELRDKVATRVGS